MYDFGSELQNLLSILEDLKEQSEQRNNRSWKWVRFWRKRPTDENLEPSTDMEREPLIGRSDRSRIPKDVPELVIERENPRVALHTNRVKGGFIKRLLRLLKILERDDG